MTPHAETAKAIRKELKTNFPGIKFRVRSESFSMGDAVNISWTDGPNRESVEKVVDKYQYGHFDGMTDSYNYSNSRKDIPQVKFVQCQRDTSPEKFEAIKNELVKNFGIENPEKDTEWFDKLGTWMQEAVYREIQEQELGY